MAPPFGAGTIPDLEGIVSSLQLKEKQAVQLQQRVSLLQKRITAEQKEKAQLKNAADKAQEQKVKLQKMVGTLTTEKAALAKHKERLEKEQCDFHSMLQEAQVKTNAAEEKLAIAEDRHGQEITELNIKYSKNMTYLSQVLEGKAKPSMTPDQITELKAASESSRKELAKVQQDLVKAEVSMNEATNNAQLALTQHNQKTEGLRSKVDSLEEELAAAKAEAGKAQEAAEAAEAKAAAGCAESGAAVQLRSRIQDLEGDVKRQQEFCDSMEKFCDGLERQITIYESRYGKLTGEDEVESESEAKMMDGIGESDGEPGATHQAEAEAHGAVVGLEDMEA
ncbi:unnamed protein product [Chrysoparadoxa australica]